MKMDSKIIEMCQSAKASVVEDAKKVTKCYKIF
jgi:hypothetical protein